MATEFQNAAVVGLGLIGGSVARDLLARGVHVIGYDRDTERLHGMRDADFHRITRTTSLQRVAQAHLIVIAVPVIDALEVLAALAPHLAHTSIVIDVGSTKRSIVAAAERLNVGAQFVGCHPMAGDHRSGWEASRAGLFVDAPVYICPSPSSTPEAIAQTLSLWIELGARPTIMDAARHDQRLAFTSHLPHVIASALARSLDSATVPRRELGPGGRDMTRVAGSSPEMWAQIFLDNGDQLRQAISAMELQLDELHHCIEAGDMEAAQRWFAVGRTWCERSDAMT